MFVVEGGQRADPAGTVAARRRIKLVLLAVMLVAFVPAAGSARSEATYRMARRLHAAPPQATLEQIERTMVAAVERAGWSARVREPGVVEAEKSVRDGKHTALVEIRFDERSFLIQYLSSHNLNYDPESCHRRARRKRVCREVIHPHYNVWVRTLEGNVMRLTVEAGKASKAPVDKGASSGVMIADELIKLKALVDQGVLTAEEFESRKKKLLMQ